MPIYFRTFPLNEPLTFESIGNHWQQENVSRPNGFSFYHYLHSEKGSGQIIIQGKKYILKESEGVLIAPFIPHSYSKISAEWLTCFASFTGTIEHSIRTILGNRSVVFITHTQGEQILSLITDCIKLYHTRPLDSRQLSVCCYAMLMRFAEGVYAQDSQNHPLYQQYVAPVIKEIERNYHTELTVQQLCRQVYITPQYLSRLFRRFLGYSTYEYLTIYRINKAKEYLVAAEHLQIQDIAAKTGFADSSHFIALFKKITGCTPLEFRRMH